MLEFQLSTMPPSRRGMHATEEYLAHGTGTIVAMLNSISVNEAIDRLAELAGKNVSVYGSLSLEFEGTCISHIPKTESCNDSAGTYQSSVWVNFDLAALNQLEQWLDQFDGRHVRVSGTLLAPQSGHDGCGHFSLWPAELNVTSIEEFNAARSAEG